MKHRQFRCCCLVGIHHGQEDHLTPRGWCPEHFSMFTTIGAIGPGSVPEACMGRGAWRLENLHCKPTFDTLLS